MQQLWIISIIADDGTMPTDVTGVAASPFGRPGTC